MVEADWETVHGDGDVDLRCESGCGRGGGGGGRVHDRHSYYGFACDAHRAGLWLHEDAGVTAGAAVGESFAVAESGGHENASVRECVRASERSGSVTVSRGGSVSGSVPRIDVGEVNAHVTESDGIARCALERRRRGEAIRGRTGWAYWRVVRGEPAYDQCP